MLFEFKSGNNGDIIDTIGTCGYDGEIADTIRRKRFDGRPISLVIWDISVPRNNL